MSFYGYPKTTSVLELQKKAEKTLKKLRKKGKEIYPITLSGKRNIAVTFWGKSWCKHLEIYADYSNRLARGRSYVRHNGVLDLKYTCKGNITALVIGSRTYTVDINIKPVSKAKWQNIIKFCSGQIGSIIELLQGTFSKNIMDVIIDTKQGLLPHKDEVTFTCSCPDFAHMCKHIIAALYGIGVRLDNEPELIFRLRSVNHMELIETTPSFDAFTPAGYDSHEILDNELSDIFGITIETKKIKKIPKQKKKRTHKKTANKANLTQKKHTNQPKC